MSEPLKLPFGRTEREAVEVAVKHRRLIWEGQAGRGLSEDGKRRLLEETCAEMCGDRDSGKLLAQRAIWTHGQP